MEKSEKGGDILMKRDLIVAVLLTFCLTVTLFQILPTSSQSAGDYDPWLDYNDDGKIDMRDIGASARAFGASGDSQRNVTIEGYNWKSYSYKIKIPSGKTWHLNITTAGYEQITIGMDALTMGGSQPNLYPRAHFLVGNRYVFLDSWNVPLLWDLPLNDAGSHMWIQPMSVRVGTGNVGHRFNVTVWAKVLEPSFVWQVKMLFNTTYLNATRVGYTVGNESDWATHRTGGSTFSPGPWINNTEGYVMAHESCTSFEHVPADVVASLCWVEFEIIEPFTDTDLDIATGYSGYTYILTEVLTEIPLTIYNSGVSSYRPLEHEVDGTYTVTGTVFTISYDNQNEYEVTLEIGAYLTT